jgi:hypothetical protein
MHAWSRKGRHCDASPRGVLTSALRKRERRVEARADDVGEGGARIAWGVATASDRLAPRLRRQGELA